MKLQNLLPSAVALLCFSFVGCVTPKNNYRPESKSISFPELNQTITVNIGDEMVKQGTYTEIDGIHISKPVKASWAYTLESGNYVKKGEDKVREFYMPDSGPNGGAVQKSALADPWQSVTYHKTKDKIGVVTIFNAHVDSKVEGVSRVKLPTLAQNSFQQTLIYSGRIGDRITLGYREFSNNMARPAFNNDVDYDLTESTTVGYKGARIEVIKATNQSITYKVFSNFISTN